jgi:hypothetical protein
LQQLPDCLQQAIARRMTPPVVDALEPVQIQQDQAQRLSRRVGGEEGPGVLAEPVPVGDARQGVQVRPVRFHTVPAAALQPRPELLGEDFPSTNVIARPQPGQDGGLLLDRIHHQDGRQTQRGVSVVQRIQALEGLAIKDAEIESRPDPGRLRVREQLAAGR